MNTPLYDQIPVRDNYCQCQRPVTRALNRAIELNDFCPNCGDRFPPIHSEPSPVLSPPRDPQYVNIAEVLHNFHQRHSSLDPARHIYDTPQLSLATTEPYSPPDSLSPAESDISLPFRISEPATPPLVNPRTAMDELAGLFHEMTATFARTRPSLSFQPSPFKGNTGDDFDDFFSKFEKFAEFNNKDEDERLQILPLLLAGRAYQIYSSLPEDTRADYRPLVNALRDKFTSVDLPLLEAANVHKSVMAPSESVKSFFDTVTLKCSKLGLSARDILLIFINGLKPDLRGFVLQNDPPDINAAYRLAKTKAAVTLDEETQRDYKKLFRTLMAKVDNTAATPSPPTLTQAPLAALSTLPANKLRDTYSHGDDRLNPLQYPFADPHPYPSNTYFPRPPDPNYPQPYFMCYTCGQPDHYARDCPLNPSSQYHPSKSRKTGGQGPYLNGDVSYESPSQQTW